MATELGIGVRVVIGWTPDHLCDTSVKCVRGLVGTIINGPYGYMSVLPSGRLNDTKENKWRVAIPAIGTATIVEHLLTPLDDFDGEQEYEQQFIKDEEPAHA